MEKPEDLRKEFPSALDIAYTQYKRDLARHRTIEEIMTHACMPLGISVHDAAVTMTSKQIRRLPITRDRELVGIITARDLVEAYAK